MSERKINSSAGSVGGFQCQRLRRSRIADLYDNEKEISSDSNSFNLDGIQYGPGTPRKPQKQSSLMRSHYTAAN